MDIKSLENTGFETIANAFNEAFCKYEIQISKQELSLMLKRRGFVPELSFGAFDDEKLVSFTLNGIGSYIGALTAYDTGTGTLEEYRGKGLASEVFNYSLPFLRKAGVSQYLLEVLQHNTTAISVYKNQGFITTREFGYYRKKQSEISLNDSHIVPQLSFQEIFLETVSHCTSFIDFIPSWQNSYESIIRSQEGFKYIGALYDGKLVGYCILEPSSGDITQIAVDKKYRRQGIGTNMLAQALRHNKNESIKVVNTDINCGSISGFLDSNSISLSGKQYEMIKKL
ncbi:MAG: GNAT family N-acetyltransferase [Rikenellaceae bacterium]|nr:GNAT family N-acetyltransferase [Rikenellaceae bacterium]